jgi:hypothetical protein
MKFCPFCSWESADICSEQEGGKGRMFYYVFCGHCEAPSRVGLAPRNGSDSTCV